MKQETTKACIVGFLLFVSLSLNAVFYCVCNDKYTELSNLRKAYIELKHRFDRYAEILAKDKNLLQDIQAKVVPEGDLDGK